MDIHEKSMDMDMDGKFRIHSKPVDNAVYRLSISLFNPEICAVKPESCGKMYYFLICNNTCDKRARTVT